MYKTVIFFATSSIILSLLAIIIRLVNNRVRQNLADILLSIALFALMWYAFIYVMVLTTYIQYVPNLYNKGIPLYYLIAPFSYFYVRLKLYSRLGLPRNWFLHLIPFFLGLIDIIPYMLASPAEKQAFMGRLLQDASLAYTHEYGFIPQSWHYIIRLILSFFYLLAQWWLLFNSDVVDQQGRRLRFALYFYTVVFSLFMALQVGMVFNMVFNRLQAAYILHDMGHLIWVSGLYLVFSIYMCIVPFIVRRS